MLAGCERQARGEDGVGEAALPGAAPEEDLSIDVWLEQLEVGSRELYSARQAVVDAMGLTDGARIADVGAGTGLYSLLFAEAVGESGHVFAVDIEPLFLNLINQRAVDAGFDNITAVFGRDDDISLPSASIDVVFVADTYHYLSEREAIMKTVYDALKPGGSLILVEYDVMPGQPRAEGKDHVRFGKAPVIAEIEYVGFELEDERNVPGLNENYFLRFKKPQ